MPKLPSGLTILISRQHFIDHGGNWFHCPDGHFWYWLPDEKISGPPPYLVGEQVITEPHHSAVPTTREEVAKFIQVAEVDADLQIGWRGEWLDSFPLFTQLDISDLVVWKKWLNSPAVLDFLDETIERCGRLAKDSEGSQGFATFHTAPQSGS